MVQRDERPLRGTQFIVPSYSPLPTAAKPKAWKERWFERFWDRFC